MTETLVNGGINVFIVSENRLLREALSKLLRKTTGIRGVSPAVFSADTMKRVAESQANVLVLDPNGTVADVLRILAETRHVIPGVRVLLTGMEADAETFVRCVGAGIAGYVLKDASGSDLAQAVLSVGNGLAVCPPELCFALFQYVAGQSQTSPFPTRAQLGLTKRERQVIGQLRSGATNKEIASHFNLAEQTVKNHIHRILRKVGASNRLNAAEICQGHELLA